MSRIAVVAAPRSCSGGARNATHAIITTGCWATLPVEVMTQDGNTHVMADLIDGR